MDFGSARTGDFDPLVVLLGLSPGVVNVDVSVLCDEVALGVLGTEVAAAVTEMGLGQARELDDEMAAGPADELAFINDFTAEVEMGIGAERFEFPMDVKHGTAVTGREFWATRATHGPPRSR